MYLFCGFAFFCRRFPYFQFHPGNLERGGCCDSRNAWILPGTERHEWHGWKHIGNNQINIFGIERLLHTCAVNAHRKKICLTATSESNVCCWIFRCTNLRDNWTKNNMNMCTVIHVPSNVDSTKNVSLGTYWCLSTVNNLIPRHTDPDFPKYSTCALFKFKLSTVFFY